MTTKSSAHQFCDSTTAALLPRADAQRAEGMRAYMKAHFEFLGIATPVRRLATRELIRNARGLSSKALCGIAGALWEMPQREYQYVAVDLLARHHKTLDASAIAFMLALARDRSWWDSVDALAGVVGDVVRRHLASDVHAQACMDAALEDEDLWVRRIAMLHQLGWRESVDVTRLFRYATALAPEPDFFIRKAIGWALRDFARYDPEGVRAFLRDMQGKLSSLSLREAGKHLG
ncbi:MAG TPA: DNA alkylation repair protein [Rhodocyclaceae bacterium]|nr:DNA alkylation repair protein [Rhodocyclaceae bacterium]